MTRILVFSPYVSRYHLFAYEGTIAKACQIRGATVEYVLCDGLLPECDMHWNSFPENIPRPVDLCQGCQARAKRNFHELDIPLKDLPYRWLGEFVNETERRDAFAWAQSLSASEMRLACFQGYPVGEWVQSSVISYFRQYPPDMDNCEVAKVYRGFLVSAATVVSGLRNYLEAYSVDSALLFNGRQSITRVAFEVFRRLGIRVLTHETPFFQRGHLMLKANARCWSIEPFTEFWRMWGQIPLTRTSLEQTSNWLKNRRYGAGLSWHAYNAPQTSDVSLKKQLNLNRSKKLLALFTSSTDETAGDPELQGPFEPQSEWTQEVVNWVGDRSDVELVVRVHPNLAGKTGLGKAVDEYNFYHKMKLAAPANTRIVMPDDSLNSYALMDEADVCLTYGSSVGYEMAMLGKPVVLASRAPYEDCSHTLNIRSKQSLPEMLEKSLQPTSAREIRREAFRLAYYYVFKFELPFPLVSMSAVMDAKLNYTTLEALSPGKDDALDHICNHLIYDQPLFDSPRESERIRTMAEEDAFFAELEQLPEPHREKDYERRLRNTSRLNRLGRSIQSAIQHLPFGTGNLLNSLGKGIYVPLLRWLGKGGR
jgi:hypothetical protein